MLNQVTVTPNNRAHDSTNKTDIGSQNIILSLTLRNLLFGCRDDVTAVYDMLITIKPIRA